MKKILSIIAIAILVSSFSVANAQNRELENGDGIPLGRPEIQSISTQNDEESSTDGIRNEKQKISEIRQEEKSTTTDELRVPPQRRENRDGVKNREGRDDRSSTTASTSSSTPNRRGEEISREHRSTVATFVKSLLDVAGKDKAIGPRVREIAKSQNDSSTTTAASIEQVDKRSGIRKFFFGSDYKNLNVIKNELATTTKNIDQLKSLIASTTSSTSRAELEAQIKTLEIEKAKVTEFVSNSERGFSLFGWATRLFAR